MVNLSSVLSLFAYHKTSKIELSAYCLQISRNLSILKSGILMCSKMYRFATILKIIVVRQTKISITEVGG